MKKLISTIFFALTACTTYAQITFQKTFNLSPSGTGMSGVVQTSDSGYVVCGSKFSPAVTYMLKLDRYGAAQWNKEISNNIYLGTNSMSMNNDGGFILCGATKINNQSDYNLALTRVDANANVIWSKAFGGISPAHGYNAKQTHDGGFITCGQYLGNPIGYLSYLIKTDSLGSLQWTKTFIDTSFLPYSTNISYDVIQCPDDGFIICGETMSTLTLPVDRDAFLIKTDSLGNIIWNKTYQLPGWNLFRSVKLTNDGGYILGGANDNPSDTLTWKDFLIVRTDSMGNVLWAKTVVNHFDDYLNTVITTADNGFVFCGSRNRNASSSNCSVFKTDSAGNFLWSKSFYSLSNLTNGNIVTPAYDGGYFIGTTRLPSVPPLAYVIKTDSTGNSNCADSMPVMNLLNISFSIISPFISSINDTMYSQTLTSINDSYSENILCFTNINSLMEENNFYNVFPNPTNDYINIYYNSSSLKEITVSLYNLYGQPLFSKRELNNGNNEIKIDLQNIPSGIYITKVFDGEKSYCKKLIVERD